MTTLRAEQSQTLPISFRPLDVEGRSRTLPLLYCPKRRAALTANTCARCEHFRRVAFDSDRAPVLECIDTRTAQGAAELPSSVQDVLRLPPMCAALDTTISRLLVSLGAGYDHQLVPVLDTSGKPRGYVTRALLEEKLQGGVSMDNVLGEVMTPFLTRVEPRTSLDDAARLIGCSCSGHLVVTDEQGSLLGVVSAEDLAR